MKLIGVLFLLTGLSLGVYSFLMDTSVSINYPMGNPLNFPTKVNNIGLMNDQRNYLIASGFLAAFGVILFVVSYFIPNEKQNLIIGFTSVEGSDKQNDFQIWKKSNPHKSIHDFYRETKK